MSKFTFVPASCRSVYGSVEGRTIETCLARPLEDGESRDGYLVEYHGRTIGYVTNWEKGNEPWSAQLPEGVLPDSSIVLGMVLRCSKSRAGVAEKALQWSNQRAARA